MSRNIVISGYYGVGNIGDEAILSAMIGSFRRQWPGCRITVLSFNPEHTRREHGVEAVNQLAFGPEGQIHGVSTLRFYRTLWTILACDKFILGGGGFLSDWQPEAPGFWLSQARLAKRLGKKTALYAIGAGPFTTETGRTFTREYIEKYVDEVSVRDRYSFQALVDDAGVRRPEVTIRRDPVFDLDIGSGSQAARGKVIGLNLIDLFSFSSFQGGKDKRDRYLRDLKQLTAFLLESFPDHRIEYLANFSGDAEFFREHLEDVSARVRLSPVADYRQLVDWLRGCEAVVAMRLHTLIFAVMTHTPVFAIVYQHKCLAVCEDYGFAFDVVSDGSLPPLPDRDLDLELTKTRIHELITAAGKGSEPPPEGDRDGGKP